MAPTKKQYTDLEKERIGQTLATIFLLRRSPEHRDRFRTTWGDKTAIGIFNTFQRLGEMIAKGEEINP